MIKDKNERIESREEVASYIQKLKFALKNGASVYYVPDRNVDRSRDDKYTNRYTINDLFPSENPVVALKRELASLEVGNYISTVKDTRYPEASELRQFGKQYNSKDVYIKIRVELISADGNMTVLVLSFHYAQYPFGDDSFPYK